MKLSHRQSTALALAKAGGGTLVRYRGGLWSTRDAKLGEDGLPYHYVKLETINSLVAAGKLTFTGYARGPVRFPCEVKLTQGRLL
jgi:hypothetical protein